MTTAIIGLASAGKTTIFNALTRSTAQTGNYGAVKSLNIGTGAKPDPRLDYLEDVFSARSKVRADMEYWDMPTDYAASDILTRQTVNSLQRAKCLLIVVRAFGDPAVPHPDGTISWTRDLERILYEILFADVDLVNLRIERINDGLKAMKSAERDAAKRNIEALQLLLAELECGTSIRSSNDPDAVSRALSGSFAISSMPLVVAVNIAESDFGVTSAEDVRLQAEDDIERQTLGPGTVIIPICGTVEEELRLMPDEESDAMRTELYGGLNASQELMDSCLDALSLETFYTASDKEVRAWHFPATYSASKSAGIVHSDMERGFIRAEIVAFDDFEQCGTMNNAKKSGVLRQEGRDYRFKDGDIANFLFSV